MTGRLGIRTGVISNFSPFSEHGLPKNETTIAEMLREEAGYATAATGKWHLGHVEGYSPIYRGFDTFLGLPMSHDYGCTHHPGYDISCPNVAQDVCFPSQKELADNSSCHIGPNNPWDESIPLYYNDKIVEQPTDLRLLSDRYADFAIEFMRNVTLKENPSPFFLYMPFNHMHVPVGNHRPEFTNTSLDRGVYGDTMRQLDESIGRVVRAVSEMKIENETLILVRILFSLSLSLSLTPNYSHRLPEIMVHRPINVILVA